jgi:N-acetylglucosamine kinase-like BadF-type ATPase
MTTTTAAATWPTQAELDPVMRHMEIASGDMDELDVRLVGLTKAGAHSAPTLQELGALVRFIELVEMDIKVMNDGLAAARAALHLGATETRVDPRAQGGSGGDA